MLAEQDFLFLKRGAEPRPVRMQLELQKTELLIQQRGIRSTIVMMLAVQNRARGKLLKLALPRPKVNNGGSAKRAFKPRGHSLPQRFRKKPLLRSRPRICADRIEHDVNLTDILRLYRHYRGGRDYGGRECAALYDVAKPRTLA